MRGGALRRVERAAVASSARLGEARQRALLARVATGKKGRERTGVVVVVAEWRLADGIAEGGRRQPIRQHDERRVALQLNIPRARERGLQEHTVAVRQADDGLAAFRRVLRGRRGHLLDVQ